MNLLSQLKHNLRRAPGRVALEVEMRAGDARRCTAGEIARGVHRHARAYAALGIGHGDRVIIALPTGAEFVHAFWACYAVGAVPVPTYPPLPGRRSEAGVVRLAEIARTARAAGFVTVPELRAAAAAAGPPLPPAVHPERVAEAGDVASTLAWLDDVPEPAPDDLALIQFTSGSTSSPRGCMLTHEAVALNVLAILDRFDIADGQTGVSWLPLYHDMGLMCGVMLPLLSGLSATLMPTERFLRDPVAWLAALTRRRSVITASPNFGLWYATSRIRGRRFNVDLSALRRLCVGAEPIDPAVARAFVAEMGRYRMSPAVLEPSWGLAENTVFVTSAPGGLRVDRVDRDALENHARAEAHDGAGGKEVVCLGTPYTGAELRVVAADGRALPERHVGEVELRSSSMMAGYFRDAEANMLTRTADGWLRTGDVGYLAAGELYLVGRAKELIICGGRNVAPHDIEAIATRSEGLRPGGAVAFGVDGDGTEQIVLLVELRPGFAEADVAREIRSACQRALAIKPAVVRAVRRGSLPRTTSGKLQRSRARSLYLRGEYDTSRPPASAARGA